MAVLENMYSDSNNNGISVQGLDATPHCDITFQCLQLYSQFQFVTISGQIKLVVV